MKYARIIGDEAVDVVAEVEGYFHPEIAAQFVEVPDHVQRNAHLIDGVWVNPPIPEPEEEEEEASPEEDTASD